jgi:hypothetical protein
MPIILSLNTTSLVSEMPHAPDTAYTFSPPQNRLIKNQQLKCFSISEHEKKKSIICVDTGYSFEVGVSIIIVDHTPD